MAKYDLYNAAAGKGYLLDIQCDLLIDLNTRVVVPLMPAKIAPKPADRLNPTFKIKNKNHVMVTQFLSSVPTGMLDSSVDNIAQHHDEITAAIDMLTQGFEL